MPLETAKENDKDEAETEKIEVNKEPETEGFQKELNNVVYGGESVIKKEDAENKGLEG